MKKKKSFNDFTDLKENLRADDQTLMICIKQISDDFDERKETFYKSKSSIDEQDYLSLAMSRLAYVFAKETKELLFVEAKRRGLLA